MAELSNWITKVSDWLTKAGLILVGSAATLVSVASIFGFLTEYPWIEERIALITLFLIGLLIMFVVFQQRDYSPTINSKIEECTKHLITEINNAPGVEVLSFENVAEFYEYVTSKLNTAKKSIDDITWGSRKVYGVPAEEEAYLNYVNMIEQVCKKGNIKYREVSSLTDERYFSRSMKLLEEEYYSYHLGYYDVSENPIPLISFIMIDSNEVIVGFYRVPTLPPEGEVHLSVSQPDLVRLFGDYFDTLWVGSDKVKEADIVNHDLINQIKNKLNI